MVSSVSSIELIIASRSLLLRSSNKETVSFPTVVLEVVCITSCSLSTSVSFVVMLSSVLLPSSFGAELLLQCILFVGAGPTKNSHGSVDGCFLASILAILSESFTQIFPNVIPSALAISQYLRYFNKTH